MLESLVFLIVVLLTVGIIAGFLTSPALACWYPRLNKPCWHVSELFFQLAWVGTYVLLGLSVYVAYESVFEGCPRDTLKWLFIAVAVGLLLYPLVFFYFRSLIGGAVLAFVLLALSIAIIYVELAQIHNPPAAALFVPVVMWFAYLFVLHVALAMANRGCGYWA